MKRNSGKEFNLKEYEKLREEILLHYKEIFRTETFFLISIVFYYAWLGTHPEFLCRNRLLVWIPVILPVLGAARSRGLFALMLMIGKYIQIIEGKIFGTMPQQPSFNDAYGYERFLNRHRSRFFGIYIFSFWIVLFLVTLIAPILVFQNDKQLPKDESSAVEITVPSLIAPMR